MSDSYDSDSSSSINNYCKKSGERVINENKTKLMNHKKKRRIVMKIDFDNSDESSTNDDNYLSDDDSMKVLRTRKPRRYFDSSSSDNNVESCGTGVGPLYSNGVKKIETSGSIGKIRSPTKNEFDSDSSSNDLLEKCPICLLTFRNQEIGSPSVCDHIFCARCIEEWSKNVHTCPFDRLTFDTIIVRDTYQSRITVREIKVDSSIIQSVNDVDEEITLCEVCSQPDREDVMLLCDSCNQGYHIDCLSPALNEIPEGSWFCDNCFDSDDDIDEDINFLYEDMREMGIPETRLTITELHQPRILRTRQNERIRATIIARSRSTRQSSNNTVFASTSAETSNSRGSRFKRNTKIKNTASKKTKKQSKVKRRPTRRTYVVEYDVNNFDEKFALKTKNRYVCRRRRRKSRKLKKKNVYKKVSKSCSGNPRLSVSSRLTGKFSFTPNNQSVRSILPSHNFSLFGSANELEYFSDNDVCSDIELGGGSTAVQTSVRISNLHTSHRNRKEIQVNLNRPSTSSQADLVSSILEMQDRWQNSVQRLASLNYGDDGSITFNGTNIEKHSSHSKDIANNNKKDNSTKVNSTDVTQAPMYPRGNYQNYAGGARGNGNNNNRFNNQSTYRSGGGNSYRNSFGNNRVNSETAQGSGNNPFNNSENNAYQFNNTNQSNFSNVNDRDRFNRHNRNNRNTNNSIRNQNISRDNSLNNSNLLFENNVPAFEPVNENSHSHLNFAAISNSVYNPRNIIPPVYGPLNSEENIATDTSISNVPSSFVPPLALPPLAPPPQAPPAINKTLFEISAGYANDDDEDDDSNCPNFSVYSVESQQAANPSVDQDDVNAQPVDSSSKEDDDEDLVQLGDEDELIEQVEMNKSELYEPENPTENVDEKDPNKIEKVNDNSCTQIIQEKNKENSLDSSSSNAEVSTDSYANNKLNDGENGNKKGILELYDDSDWEELDSELNQVKNSPGTNETNDNCDADRSYTPCLDENENPNDYDDGGFTPEIGLSTIPPMLNNLNIDDLGDGRTNDRLTSNIDGIETELISEDDSDESEKKKDDDNQKNGSEQKFKKITKSQRERNYRSEKTKESSSTHRRHSRSQTNDKENEGEKHPKKNERKRIRRQELPRYDVRNVIGQQPRINEDRFGRNTSRPPRSRSRSRHQRNSRSRSRSFSRRRKRRSFSISPSPNGHYSGRTPHRHFSPRRSKARYRSRSHSPLPRQFSPIRRRSRSPLRIRSRSNSEEKLRQPKRLPRLTKSKTPPRRVSPRTHHSKSPERRAKNKRKRSKDRKKRKTKRRPLSVSPAAPIQHTFYNATPVNIKKKRHHTLKNRSPERAWSPSPSPETANNVDANISWTPPLTYLNKPVSLTTVAVNNKHKKEKKKREKKRRKGEKRRDVTNTSRKEKRRRRVSELRESPAVAPSKEVFASGNNILVSVSFNKDTNPAPQTTVVTLPPTREEILSGIRRSRDRQTRRIKYPKEKQIKKHKKTDAKPVAIIDLERSPFQVTQPMNDIIILTDSEGGNDDLNDVGTPEISSVQQDHQQTENFHNLHRSNNEQSPIMDRLDTLVEEPFEIQQFGPKTPPEPPTVKFAITIKNKQIKSRNPLHNDGDDNESTTLEEQQDRQEVEDSACSSGLITNVIGPNTPSDLGPCSPDAYDPFDPTKSPSMSPQSPAPKTEMPHVNIIENEGLPEIRETRNMVPVNQEKVINSVDLGGLKGSKTTVAHTTTQDVSSSNEMGIQFNLLQSVENENADDTVSNGAIGGDTGGNSSTGADNSNIQVLSNMLLSGNDIQHLPPIASPIIKSSTQSLISKLPLPKLCSNSRANISGSGNGCGSSNVNDDILEIESPYSPSPADFEDLFEPPPDTNGANVEKQYSNFIRTKNTEMFDSLFGSSPGHSRMLPFTGSTGRKQRPSKSSKKTSVKVGKLPGDEQIRLYDDVPNSAVELQVKDKYLRKLNRQERVVEEVKLVLKPHFNKKYITKEDYKDIMRKSVPKICHSKSGEINPKKIQNLIEAYVKKYRQKNKLNLLNTQGQVSSAVKCAAYLKKL